MGTREGAGLPCQGPVRPPDTLLDGTEPAEPRDALRPDQVPRPALLPPAGTGRAREHHRHPRGLRVCPQALSGPDRRYRRPGDEADQERGGRPREHREDGARGLHYQTAPGGPRALLPPGLPAAQRLPERTRILYRHPRQVSCGELYRRHGRRGYLRDGGEAPGALLLVRYRPLQELDSEGGDLAGGRDRGG